MKRLSLMVVGLLLTAISYSQDFYRVLRSTQLEYKDSTWVELATQYPKDLFIIMKGYDLTIGTVKFKTYDDVEKINYTDHITYTWKCIDADGNNCLYMMKQFDPKVSNHVVHEIAYNNGKAWEYETE